MSKEYEERKALIYALGNFLLHPESSHYDSGIEWMIDIVQEIENPLALNGQLCHWCEKRSPVYTFENDYSTPDVICKQCYLDYIIGGLVGSEGD